MFVSSVSDDTHNIPHHRVKRSVKRSAHHFFPAGFRYLLPDPECLPQLLYHLQCWKNISSPHIHPTDCRIFISILHLHPVGYAEQDPSFTQESWANPDISSQAMCVWCSSILIRFFSMWRNCWSPQPVRRLNPDALTRCPASIKLTHHSLPKPPTPLNIFKHQI